LSTGSAQTTPGPADPPAWQRQFVEQVGMHTEVGVPRSLARVLAWLVVCEPHHQSAGQLRQVLQLSAGSVSSATSLLVRFGIVARVSFPGDRRIYYEMHPDGWQRLLRIRLRELVSIRHVAETAIEAAGGRHDERLRGMRDFYAECEAQFATLIHGEAAAVSKSAPTSGRRRKRAR